MTASELIAHLRDNITKHGDLPVIVGTRDDSDAEVAKVKFDPDLYPFDDKNRNVAVLWLLP